MSDIGIQKTVEALILTLGIVPTSTVATGGANSGATSVTVANNAGFVIDSQLSFADALGEERLKIASLSGSTGIALTFTNVGYSGLQHTHTTGTQVYCNLKSEKIVQAGSSLNTGKPLIWVHCDSEDRGIRAVGKKGSTYSVEIGYHRALEQRSGAELDPNLFYDRQMLAARTDLESIAAAFDSHWQLLLTGQQRAVKLGKWRSTTPYIRKRWNATVRRVDTLQLVAVMAVDIEADFGSIAP